MNYNKEKLFPSNKNLLDRNNEETVYSIQIREFFNSYLKLDARRCFWENEKLCQHLILANCIISV